AGAGPRVYKTYSSDGFILSYDAYTYKYQNPLQLLDGYNKTHGIVCIEHPLFTNLEEDGLDIDYSFEVIKEKDFDFNSPRKISLKATAENAALPAFQDFLKQAKKFHMA
ncbi:MAG TPA: hypothetical protein PLF01_07895, partial [Alphaproteobacteria bacterium]|nr:hypothetical protein [Alphaproteobacteria bacterium]